MAEVSLWATTQKTTNSSTSGNDRRESGISVAVLRISVAVLQSIDAIKAEAHQELTDGFNLMIDALKLNGLTTIYGVPGIPITDFGRMAQAAGLRVISFKCKGWETDPNAYIYFITQAPVWEKICDVIGQPGWKTHPDYAKPPARLSRLNEIFARIEQWTMTKTKFEAMDILNKDDIPCGPILSMKEIIEDQSLRATGTVVEVDHPTRGKYFSVGNPIKLSDSPSDVTRSPLLGEHTDEILRQVLGFTDHQVAEIHDSGALDPPRKVVPAYATSEH